ncbi:MAG: DEAD/DEAH box helicase [Acidimicrobiia bacterium]|nr:DEAD/DEAH box helicase [Acidimicrobiia bacterium]
MTITFRDLGVSDPVAQVLLDRGIESPFPIQELALPDALAGRDVCGKAKTGSGKTLAFGIPVLERMTRARPRTPTGLVLVPTRELANQVCDELTPLGSAVDRTVSAIYGGADIDKQIRKLGKGVDLVVATPGRMIDLVERKEISLAEVAHVVVDEADRMADMGFLPQVEWLLRHIEREHQTLLFSATLDGVVNTLIKRYQTDPAMCEVESKEITVAEMVHRFIAVHEMDKAKVAGAISAGANRAIMFCRTKWMCDKLAGELQKLGIEAAAIHGDLRQSNRERALADFAAGNLHVLVATDVAARGIHVDEVDLVLHYDPPQDQKAYLHRSGRTARAGAGGLVVTLVIYKEELEVRRLQKRLKIEQPIVEMFSNDERLRDLTSFDPSEAA